MADLGNSKIKDTYTLVLQTDASGNLQKLDGTTPNPFIVNGTLRYTVGPTDGYVLTSDAAGNASWTEGGGVTYWSANTNGSISPSGRTTTVLLYSGGSTNTNKNALEAVGNIRVSGDVTTELSGNVITQDILLGHSGVGGHGLGGSIRPAVSGRPVTFRNYDHGSADWLSLQEDEITFFINGQAYNIFSATDNQFNATHIASRFAVHSKKGNRLIEGSTTLDTICLASQGSTAIGGSAQRWATSTGYDSGTPNKTLQVNGLTHILSGSSGSQTSWSAATTALLVSGNTHVEGNISGATNLYIDGTATFGTASTLIDTTGVSGTTLSASSTVTALGGFIGDLTGNADTVTNGAYTTDKLSVFAATTSSELAGVISNETGSGSLVFGTNPVLTTPNIGTPSAGNLTSCTAYRGDSSLVTAGIVTTGTWASNRRFDPTPGAEPGEYEGDIVYFGEPDTTTIGAIYYYSNADTWEGTEAGSPDTSTGLLAVALTETGSAGGMLIKGMVTLGVDPGDIALPIYLSESAKGSTTTAPTTSGAVVRVVGYSLSSATAKVWFNPDNTWVELS